MKDKKLYNKPEDIQIDNKLKSFLNKNTYKKTSKNMLLLIILNLTIFTMKYMNIL